MHLSVLGPKALVTGNAELAGAGNLEAPAGLQCADVFAHAVGQMLRAHQAHTEQNPSGHLRAQLPWLQDGAGIILLDRHSLSAPRKVLAALAAPDETGEPALRALALMESAYPRTARAAGTEAGGVWSQDLASAQSERTARLIDRIRKEVAGRPARHPKTLAAMWFVADATRVTADRLAAHYPALDQAFAAFWDYEGVLCSALDTNSGHLALGWIARQALANHRRDIARSEIAYREGVKSLGHGGFGPVLAALHRADLENQRSSGLLNRLHFDPGSGDSLEYLAEVVPASSIDALVGVHNTAVPLISNEGDWPARRSDAEAMLWEAFVGTKPSWAMADANLGRL